DRRFADPLVQIEQASLVGHLGAWLGGNQTPWWRRWNRMVQIARSLAHEAAGADGADLLLRRAYGSRGCCCRLGCRCWFAGDGRRVLFGHFFLWLGRRLLAPSLYRYRLIRFNGRWPRLKTEPMCLADHGIAAHSAQLVRDLARGHAFAPQRLQLFDPFV